MKKTHALFYASLTSSLFAFGLMMLGAYTRLTDAGLGCPDWPACYGHWIPDTISALRNPSLHLGKAWTEMLHRYMAGLLGMGILGLIFAMLRNNRSRNTWILAGLISSVLLFQALLGMWTVTLKLWPVVVMGHLMGGMLLLSLLWMTTLYCYGQKSPNQKPSPLGGEGGRRSASCPPKCKARRRKRVGDRVRVLRVAAALTLFVLILQIALGGWTSAHYAALICPSFPSCNTQTFSYDFSGAFHLGFIPGGVELLGADALRTIHMLHRIGALICAMLIGALVVLIRRTQRDPIVRRIGLTIALLLLLQIGLGIGNVLAKTPLIVAVAHHAVSALLLLSMISLNIYLLTPHHPHPALRATRRRFRYGVQALSPKGRGDLNEQAPFGKIFRDYLTLCKPKVVLMMLVTALVGMYLSIQTPLPWSLCLYATVGIGLCSASAAVLNHLIDRKLDSKMMRTHDRPLAQQRITLRQAMLFATALAGSGFGLLVLCVNTLCAVLTLMAFIGYALIYSLLLKHRTPQNIVIGGAAGAMPPLLGWVAMQGEIQALAWLPVLIIFAWTPPHFWALAIARQEDYHKAQVPMLPLTHGVAYTKLSMLLYTVLLLVVSLLPYATGLSGLYYLIAALCLGFAFLGQMIRLYRNPSKQVAAQSFGFSILYLLVLFLALLFDHFTNGAPYVP